MAANLSPARLKRARLALFAIFFTQGVAAITTLPRIPELIDQIDVDFAQWGAIIGFSGLGSLVPLVFTNKLVNRFGTSPVIRTSAFAIVLLLASQAWITSPALFFAALFLQSFGFSTFNISLNAQAVMLQNKLGKVMLGAFHGSWSIGAAFSATLSGWLASFMPLWWRASWYSRSQVRNS
jgi:MFS family permease